MSCYRDALFDFHFIRFDHKREIWFHKIGFYKPPAVFVENEDNMVELKYGREPITYSISNEFTFSKYEYAPVGYFAIKELKKTNK